MVKHISKRYVLFAIIIAALLVFSSAFLMLEGRVAFKVKAENEYLGTWGGTTENGFAAGTGSPADPHACGGADGVNITYGHTLENNGAALNISNAGSYYLKENITHSPIVISGKTTVVNLCLNGHKMVTNESNGIVVGKDATLNVYDCNGSNSKHYYSQADKYSKYNFTTENRDKFIEGGLFVGRINAEYSFEGFADSRVDYNAYLNIYGGTFSGSPAILSSGTTVIYNGDFRGGASGINAFKGTFLFKNGNVFDNAYKNDNRVNYSPGISISGDCVFTMDGGKISNNVNGKKNTSSSLDGDAAHYGGGVSIAHGATFNFNGGEISNNEAYCGGGIAMLSEDSNDSRHSPRKLNITGGKILNNTARFMGGGIFIGFAHLYVPEISNVFSGMDMVGRNLVDISGGEITGNTARKASGIAFGDGDFYLSGVPKIYGNLSKTFFTDTDYQEYEDNLLLMDVEGKLMHYTNSSSVRATKTSKLTIKAPLISGTEKAKIGVAGIDTNHSNEAIKYPDANFTSGYGYLGASGYNKDVHPSQYFIADARTQRIILNESEAKFARSFTVTYMLGNESTGAPPLDTGKYGETSADKAVVLGQGALKYKASTKAVFAGWEAGNDFYAVGEEIIVNKDMVLFPVWDRGWDVEYNYNRVQSDVPTDRTIHYIGDTVSVLFTPKPSASGKIFLGWSANSRATVPEFTEGGTNSFVAGDCKPIILYAIWKDGASVTFDKSGGTGAVPIDNNEYDPAAGTQITLPGAGDLVKTGSVFEGWTTEYSGSGTKYQEGDKFTVTADVTFYAKWKAYIPAFINTSLKVTPGTAGSAYEYGGDVVKATITEGVVVYQSTDERKPTWLTIDQLTGKLTATAPVKGTFTFTLMARNGHTPSAYVQKEITLEILDSGYFIIYDGNGSTTGIVPTDDKVYSAVSAEQASIKGKSTLSKNGFMFKEWNTKADGSGVKYKEGDTYAVVASLKLYAIWQAYKPSFANATEVLPPAGEGDAYSYLGDNVKATIEGGTLVYSISGSGLPSWLTIDANTGKLTATSPVKGNYSFKLKAANFDDQSSFVEKNITLAVIGAITNITVSDPGNNKANNEVNVVINGLTGEETISYSKTETGTFVKDRPIFKEPGTYDLYIKITKPGYADKIIKITIIIGTNPIIGVVVPEKATGETNKPIQIPISGLIEKDEISYSLAEDGNYEKDKPIFIVPGEYDVYIKVVRPGFEDLIEKVKVTITGDDLEETFEIIGKVTDSENKGLANATVVVKAGNRIFGSQITDTNGKFTFKNLPKNLYNLIVVYENTTVTTVIDLNDDTEKNIKFPKLNLNSVVEVKDGVPDIVIDGLNDLFTDKDKALVDEKDTSVEIKLQIGGVSASDTTQKLKDYIKDMGGSFVLDINLLKSIKVGLGDANVQIITQADGLIKIIIPLPTGMTGKKGYKVIRDHGGEIHIITTEKNEDGEYIEVSEDMTSITIFTKKFSQYAIAYDKVEEGGGTGHNPIACGAHWLILIALVIYILFIIFWYVVLRRQRLDIISFLATAGFIVLNIIFSFNLGCTLCVILIIISWLIALLGALLFIFGKKVTDDCVEKFYQKNPAKLAVKVKKAKEKTAKQSKIFSEQMRAKADKEREDSEKAQKTHSAEVATMSAGTEASIAQTGTESENAATSQSIEMGQVSLSQGFKMMLVVPLPIFKGANKATIANYLEKKYVDDVITNKRPNFISTGLPLADTHYAPKGIVYVAGKPMPIKVTKLLQGVCFVYVYELAEDRTMLLVKTNDEHAKQIREDGHNIYRSKYPKSGKWFMISVDDTFKSDKEVFELIDKAKTIAETPIEEAPTPTPEDQVTYKQD